MSAQTQRIGSLRSASMKSPARAQSTRTEMVALKPGSLVLRVLVLLACAASAVPALASDALWKRIGQGGVAVMIRHAQTVPGIGDPPAFRIGDCSTQRNLSAEGRAQAARLGAAFKARGIRPARVLSSQWCRCIDTATAAFGHHTEESALNSFFEGRGTVKATDVQEYCAVVQRLAQSAGRMTKPS